MRDREDDTPALPPDGISRGPGGVKLVSKRGRLIGQMSSLPIQTISGMADFQLQADIGPRLLYEALQIGPYLFPHDTLQHLVTLNRRTYNLLGYLRFHHVNLTSARRALLFLNLLEAPEVRSPTSDEDSDEESDVDSDGEGETTGEAEEEDEGEGEDEEQEEEKAEMEVNKGEELEVAEAQRVALPETPAGRHSALRSLCISFRAAEADTRGHLQSFWTVFPIALRRMDCLTSLTISYAHRDTLALKRYTDIATSFPPSLIKIHFRPISRERDCVELNSHDRLSPFPTGPVGVPWEHKDWPNQIGALGPYIEKFYFKSAYQLAESPARGTNVELRKIRQSWTRHLTRMSRLKKIVIDCGYVQEDVGGDCDYGDEDEEDDQPLDSSGEFWRQWKEDDERSLTGVYYKWVWERRGKAGAWESTGGPWRSDGFLEQDFFEDCRRPDVSPGWAWHIVDLGADKSEWLRWERMEMRASGNDYWL